MPRTAIALFSCAVSAAALLGATGAWAQSTTVDQVIVTAPRTTPLDQIVSVDKTGAKIQDVPRSVQIVPLVLMQQQGATKLTDVLRDVSGATQGGQFAFGFFDRVIVRGLNATYLNDGLPDGTSDLTGIVHSVTGVERVEVLKGPGSAMFGSSEPGGVINLVHFRPSDSAEARLSEQLGSFGTTTTDVSVTGPTDIRNVDFRIDGEYQSSDGFRDARSETAEVLTSLSWRPANHDVEARFEYRHLENRPDSAGIPFSPPTGTGQPLAVSTDNKYYTPYAFADQDIGRFFLSDAWTVNDYLTINLRGAYSRRDIDLARNAGGSVKLVSGLFALSGRQLREQSDSVDDLNFQAEPTWRFTTGRLKHLLITGFEARGIDGTTQRATADLPNISNIFDPVIHDGTLAGLTFKCDSGHNCDNAKLSARFYGLYAIDQIDVGDKLKVRLSVRQDRFETEGEARTLVPVNGGQQQPCTPPKATACPWVPGVPIQRTDTPLSWDVGAVYFLTPELSVFGGYSSDTYPIFNTEEPESIGQTPETGKQIEGGLRWQPSPAATLSTSVYRTTREHVFTLLLVPNPAGPGNIDIAQVFSYGITGWETDVNLRPTAAWNVIANAAVQDGTITSFPQTPANVGHKPPSVPSFLANLWTTYDVSLPSDAFRTLQLSLGARYRNNEYSDAGLTRKIPGVTLIDAGLALPVRNFTFNLGVQNVFDRRNFLYGDGTGGGAAPGPGRTFFARFSARVW